MNATGACQLGLGTAQFGLHYGITNERGHVPDGDIATILRRCADSGIETIDTAHSYGDSEAAIGRNSLNPAFEIITKTPKLGHAASRQEVVALLLEAFHQSLEKLRRQSLHALLIHDPTDLFGPYGDALWTAMEALKADGLVQAIGVSVYEGPEIQHALDRYPIDIVQLPWSPVDHRLEKDGKLAQLAQSGVEVHARSIFLQGLLLQYPSRIPERFGPIRAAVQAMDKHFAELGVSRLEGILALAFARAEIARFIIGVTSVTELAAVIEAAQRAQSVTGVRPITTDIDPIYLNPSKWHALR